jgi:hypothetical protein
MANTMRKNTDAGTRDGAVRSSDETLVMRVERCAVESRCFSVGDNPPGNWFVPPGNNRSGGRGNEAAGAFGVEGRFSDSVSM